MALDKDGLNKGIILILLSVILTLLFIVLVLKVPVFSRLYDAKNPSVVLIYVIVLIPFLFGVYAIIDFLLSASPLIDRVYLILSIFFIAVYLVEIIMGEGFLNPLLIVYLVISLTTFKKWHIVKRAKEKTKL